MGAGSMGLRGELRGERGTTGRASSAGRPEKLKSATDF